MDDLTNHQKETFLQTIKARLERSKKGDISFVPDPNGKWRVMGRTSSGLVRYFEPRWAIGFDAYSNPTDQEAIETAQRTTKKYPDKAVRIIQIIKQYPL